MTAKGRAWAGLLATGGTAVLLVVLADRALSSALPVPLHPEVEDGVAALQASDPDVLVLGSSHLRTFFPVAQELDRRTRGARRMVPVPVDWGHMASYLWTWQHRLRPLVDPPDPGAAPPRPALRRAVLVTQWWDFRRPAPEDDPVVNLPARSWTLGDWLDDVLRHGMTDYNRNYVLHRWQRLFRGSPLVATRGRSTVLDWARGLIRPDADEARKRRYDDRLRYFQSYLERGGARLVNDEDAAALDALLQDWTARGWDVTILLYPRMKGMATPAARRDTLGPFSEFMAGRARAHGVRLLDLSLDHPLQDGDFGPDLDHPTDEANRRFAAWVLDGPLSFLAGDLPGPPPPPPAPGGAP